MPSFSISPEDRIRLRHMLDAALEIQQYVRSSTREDLNRDRKLLHSLVRLLEIVGEAANQVSRELRDQTPDIPWVITVGMRTAP
ncbi:MAG TPA: HepT-like ribonuclease domain-containing protein [Sedimentisphaerales bacterium]|nr:HepT-like ribonuclease domain-containing protein [Sedimentisphaerales bacterium]